MILPPRPLRVDPAFVRHSWLRVLGFLAPGLVLFVVVGLWQGRAAYELALDQRAWRDGESVEVTSVESNVVIVAALSRHVRITATFVSGEGEQLVVRDDYWTLFTDSVEDGPLVIHNDEETARAALSWSMEAAGWRWAWIVFFGFVLGGFGAFLSRIAWRALRALRVARAAALASEEVELEVIEVRTQHESLRLGAMDITYRIPPVVSRAPVGYRQPAATASSTHTEHFDLAERRPVLLESRTRLLALRPDPRRGDVTVLSDGFWPFLLEAGERASASARIERRLTRERGAFRDGAFRDGAFRDGAA